MHEDKVDYRWTDTKWFETAKECLKDARRLSFDYCCGYYITTETIEADLDTLTSNDESEKDVR